MSGPVVADAARDVAAAVAAFECVRLERAALEAKELLALAGLRALIENVHGPVERSSRADVASRSVVAELATAGRIGERTVRRWADEAADLVDRFGDAVVALGDGRISRSHLRVIYEHGAVLTDDDARRSYVDRMLRVAEDATPARLREVARIAADRAMPRSIDERHRAARARRGISVLDLADGMSELAMVLPSVLAHAIYDRATALARATEPGPEALRLEGEAADDPHPATPAGEHLDVDGSGDGRCLDERRADAVCDLLLTGTAATCLAGAGEEAIRATVQITVPVLTLVGAGDEPALLAGSGPVDLNTARRLAGAASGWERVMTSPVTGAVVAVDRYTPSSAQKRMLRARDEHCRFPGCRRPVHRCDVDHTRDHAHGGETRIDNLAHLCRHHHTLKHATAWTVVQQPGGVLRWTSPTGRSYVDRPEPTVRFLPASREGRSDADDHGLSDPRSAREPGPPPPF